MMGINLHQEKSFLQPRHRAILDMTFGLHEHREHKVSGIAAEFGVTVRRIQAVRRDAMNHLFKIVALQQNDEPITEMMLVELWSYETLVFAIQELKRRSRY